RVQRETLWSQRSDQRDRGLLLLALRRRRVDRAIPGHLRTQIGTGKPESTMGNLSTTHARRSKPAGRRHPLATVALILVGLVTTGGAYAMFTSTATAETAAVTQATVEEGQ